MWFLCRLLVSLHLCRSERNTTTFTYNTNTHKKRDTKINFKHLIHTLRLTKSVNIRGGILNIVVSFVLSFVVSPRDNTALILL